MRRRRLVPLTGEPRRGRLADKSTQLILDALARAAAEPAGLSLYAQKSEPGLFPATTVAKAAADRAKADGLLQVVQSRGRGRAMREVCVLTDKGRQFLAHQASPRQVIEDFVRVLEDRQAAVAELSAARRADGRRPGGHPHGGRTGIPPADRQPPIERDPDERDLHPGPPTAPAASDTLIADVKARLAEWHAASGSSQDCPLSDLYRDWSRTNR